MSKMQWLVDRFRTATNIEITVGAFVGLVIFAGFRIWGRKKDRLIVTNFEVGIWKTLIDLSTMWFICSNFLGQKSSVQTPLLSR
jgi:hypothetical protein